MILFSMKPNISTKDVIFLRTIPCEHVCRGSIPPPKKSPLEQFLKVALCHRFFWMIKPKIFDFSPKAEILSILMRSYLEQSR